MYLTNIDDEYGVNCRVGSLESLIGVPITFEYVNCRVGSLEKDSYCFCQSGTVNCRVGSLENTIRQCG